MRGNERFDFITFLLNFNALVQNQLEVETLVVLKSQLTKFEI